MLNTNFTPFPNIETERLLLRQINANDVQEVLELRGNPKTMYFIPRPLAKNHEDAMEHIDNLTMFINNNQAINWAVTLKGNPKLLGIMGLFNIHTENQRCEIGYMILPEYSGQGITTEAIKAITSYGFNTINLHSIEAKIDPENVGSEKVVQKVGFVKEAHLTENEFYNGKFASTMIYSLLKRNYNKITN